VKIGASVISTLFKTGSFAPSGKSHFILSIEEFRSLYASEISLSLSNSIEITQTL